MESVHRAARTFGVTFAIVFPTIVTWVYFVSTTNYSTGTKQAVYLLAKIVQFAIPIAWSWFVLHESPHTARPTTSGQLLGLGFGGIVAITGIAIFHFQLRGSAVFALAGTQVNQKIAAFGIDTAGTYFLLAGFYSIFHSLLEEYYWRWFVFRQLRQLVSQGPAIIGSALAFTLHHIVVLSVFFKGVPWLIAVLSAAVAVGGVFWAWLYQRSNSLFDTWPSHFLIDAGLFFGIGYELVRQSLATG